ncbi:MAG: phosphoenolpyruvate carboxylase [Fusobacteria bacterium]|nr:MAG: phosphoenolpyruvate carboxylase [Fusobacteriota bacterium]KAF0228833.1 MAG: phosphoenolpyruvate [Fusobacteriota bacterium]
MRKYPISMGTQHPDNSGRYISIQNEPEEAFHILEKQEKGGLGIEEIMIDFEGKLTPYHQTSQIALGLISKGIIPGKDVRITPRIPNAVKEPVFRQLMSIMSLVETNILAYRKSSIQAITETVVPMIETGEELVTLSKRINSVIELGNKNYDIQFPLDSIKIIPLVETVPALANVDNILDIYDKEQRKNGIYNDSYRVMLARSDSAMSYGMVSSVLAIRIALSKLANWSVANGVEVAPILGCGSLPFRGHLTKKNLNGFMKNYAGVKTFSIQSGMRYDHGESETRRVVNALAEGVDSNETRIFSSEEILEMQEMIGIFSKHYLGLFGKLICTVDFISKYIPKNRDRLAGVKTDLQYSRESVVVDEIAALVKDENLKSELLGIDTHIECSVPRAISFTASLYTLGMPPEFIGIGKGLKEVMEKYGDVGIIRLNEYYPLLRADLLFASKFVNSKVAKGIVSDEARVAYDEDFQLACEIMGINLDVDLEEGLYHTLLMSARPIILHLMGKSKDLFDDVEEEQKILKEWIIKMGKIRKSLG